MRNFVCLLIFAVVLSNLAFATEDVLDNTKNLTLKTTESSIDLQFDLSGFSERFSPTEASNLDFIDVNQGMLLIPGKPMLPAISKFVVVHPTAGLDLVITPGRSRRIETDNQPLLFEDEKATLLENGIDFEEDGLFPSELAKMSEPVIIRGVRVVKITTYPVQYDSKNSSYIFHEQISSEIRYTDADPVQPVLNPVRRHRSQEFLKYIRTLTVNGDQIGRDDLDDEVSYVGHYLIVTNENCLEYAAPFIEWRRKAGNKVDILSFSGDDALDPDLIKDGIQDLYDSYLDEGIDPFDQILLIGDRGSYYNQGAGQWILGAFRGNSIWGGIDHSDYEYACLEGNDDFPDVGFARLPNGSRELMELAIGRIMAYEAEPYMEETEWFTKGAVYSQHWGTGVASAWHVSINTNVRWGNQVLEQLGFDDIEFFEDYEWDRNGQRIGPWFRDIYNEGRNVLIGRAQLWNWQDDFNGVNNNVIFPINIATNGMGDWSGNHMFRTGDGDNLRGPVALTFGHGDSPTIPMSCVWMEMTNGILLKDLTLGWGRVLGVTALEGYIDDFNYHGQPIYLHVKTDIEAFGDPGIQPWIGIPLTVETEIPEIVTPETRMLQIHVFDPEEEADIVGAQVTFYAPGNIPDFDDEDYAAWDEMVMATTTSDADGIARVVFDERNLFDEGTQMYITVSGRDILPHFDEIEIAVHDLSVELGGYDLIEVEGNEDGDINPGETFTLEINAHNNGNDAIDEELTATINCSSPWITVEDNEIEFGEIDPGEEVLGNPGVVFTVSDNCPDGLSRPLSKPTLIINFTSGDQNWSSAIKLDPVAPKFTVSAAGDDFQVPTGANDLEITIRNTGRIDSPEMAAQLISLIPDLTLIVDESNYPEIEVNGQAGLEGEDFRVSTTAFVVPGQMADLMLILTTEADFVDSVLFTVQLGEESENAPQPPDKYGYICVDDTDEEWDVAPVYEWIEINPDEDEADFEGELMDFEGESLMDIGEALVIPLGFEAQFYGSGYEEITVSTNGFIVFGDHELMVNFQNWPLDRGIGGIGMAAPFWDWLKFGDNSAIYAFYDEDNARFIVEWYKLRHLENDEVDLTFQVIIKDPNIWVNETGDSDIKFQYNSIANIPGPEHGRAERERNNYFASVGISSPDGTIGINYTFNNEYPITSAEIEDGRAILYTTIVNVRRARIFGQVIDFETREPIPDATILTVHGFVAFTDEEGRWEMNNVLTEMEFFFMVSAPGYNVIRVDVDPLEEDEEREINIELTHPEFSPSEESFEASLEIGEEIEFEFEVTNTGNGPLNWIVDRELIGDANREPWELRRSLQVGEDLEDERVQAVAFADNNFFIASGNNSEPIISRYNRNYELVEQISQPEAIQGDRKGFRDLAWDGELLWGAHRDRVYGINLEGEVIEEWESPYGYTSAITYDSDLDVIWIAYTTANPVAFTREGERIDSLEINRQGLRIYGMAYWPDDPDDHPIYALYRDQRSDLPFVHKFNTEGDTIRVSSISRVDDERPLGAFITNQFDVYSWIFMDVKDISNANGGDQMEIWQLDVRKDWMQVEPTRGMLEADAIEEFILALNATDLAQAEFVGDLVFRHNAEGGETRLGITLEVVADNNAPDVHRLNLSMGFNIMSLNVDPLDPDVREIMEPLVERGVLRILKDGLGRFFAPAQDYNNIPQWAVENGYNIHVTEAVRLEVTGTTMPPDTPILLTEGWNMKSYYPNESVEAPQALSGIEDVLFIAKNGLGQFYLPSYNFSNMDIMTKGQGYQYKVDEDVELVYCVDNQDAVNLTPEPLLHHYPLPVQTDRNMSVLIIGSPSMAEWEAMAISSSGTIVGAGRFDNSGRCGLAVWGNSDLDGSLAGLADGEPFTLRVWNGQEENSAELELENPTSGLKFDANGVLAGILKFAELPQEFALTVIYPNPFNSQSRLNYTLPEKGEINLTIYNLAGQKVTQLVNGTIEAGYHSTVWDATGMPSGIYFVRLNGCNVVKTAKMMVLR